LKVKKGRIAAAGLGAAQVEKTGTLVTQKVTHKAMSSSEIHEVDKSDFLSITVFSPLIDFLLCWNHI
jgi:hypothetical protein